MDGRQIKIGDAIIKNRIGLGCMSMSGNYGKRNDEESMATIREAIEHGVNFIDTADFYGAGHNEELVGKAISKYRQDIFLSVKIGPMIIPGGGISQANGNPDYIKSALAYSLQRLKTDYIDLYFPSRIDPSYPIEEQMNALLEMKGKGYIKNIGLSEASVETIRKAHSIHPIAAVQAEYSLWSREPDNDLLPVLRELNIPMVGYSPLSRGFLSGTIKNPEDISNDSRRFFPRFQGNNFYNNIRIVERLNEMAKNKGCSTSQLAIAWVLTKGDDIICLPGTKKRKYLIENIKSWDVSLTQEDLLLLDEISPGNAVEGTRYNENGMSMLNK